MLFLGYDPGGEGKNGVAALEINCAGEICGDPDCETAKNAGEAWEWFEERKHASAIGIDTLMAWSPSGSRECDNKLRQHYREYGSSVIAQNGLYSSMTLNGAMVAQRAAKTGLPVFESHPKLLIRALRDNSSGAQSVLAHYADIKANHDGSPANARRADDKADAVVAAWCAAQGFLGRWNVDLFDDDESDLEKVVPNARYPWFERLGK